MYEHKHINYCEMTMPEVKISTKIMNPIEF